MFAFWFDKYLGYNFKVINRPELLWDNVSIRSEVLAKLNVPDLEYKPAMLSNLATYYFHEWLRVRLEIVIRGNKSDVVCRYKIYFFFRIKIDLAISINLAWDLIMHNLTRSYLRKKGCTWYGQYFPDQI